MSKLVSVSIVEIGKKEAEKYRSMNTYEGQRPIREKRLTQLIYESNAGTFRTGEFALARLKYDGNRTVLMNGQHQSEMVMSTGKTIKAKLEIHECEDPEDTARLFRKFDNGGGRSFQNMLHAESIALKIKWPLRVSNLVASSAAMKEGKRTEDKQFKVELLRKYLNFGKFLNSILFEKEKGVYATHLMKIAVVYPMLMTFEKCQEEARVFWTRVRDGVELKTSMPEYKLRNYLMGIAVGAGRGASPIHFKIASEHEITSKCIHAWNATRKGMTTDLKYYSTASIPKVI